MDEDKILYLSRNGNDDNSGVIPEKPLRSARAIFAAQLAIVGEGDTPRLAVEMTTGEWEYY